MAPDLNTTQFFMYSYLYENMSKNISVSDHVYRLLTREKGDKSFSEVIEERMETSGKIADVAGLNILEEGTMEKVKDDVRGMSEGTLERLE